MTTGLFWANRLRATRDLASKRSGAPVTISNTQFTQGVRRPPAKDILFAAADKSRWLEGLAQDRRVTDYDVRVCLLIGSEVVPVYGTVWRQG